MNKITLVLYLCFHSGGGGGGSVLAVVAVEAEVVVCVKGWKATENKTRAIQILLCCEQWRQC
jgi:hypothetical protein